LDNLKRELGLKAFLGISEREDILDLKPIVEGQFPLHQEGLGERERV